MDRVMALKKTRNQKEDDLKGENDQFIEFEKTHAANLQETYEKILLLLREGLIFSLE
jgi:hypothetical protein